MPSDLTRPATGDLRQHYEAVVMQQGRVILDRDFNALQDIVSGRISADALDEIGPCGTPDDGLAVSLPPPVQPASASVSFSPPHPWDFLVKPGTMYVGGRRVVFEEPPANQPPLSYFHQPDWPRPFDPFGRTSASVSFPRHEFVFLHAFEQEVGAVEDPDLLDVALGGPDTTQRVRLMRRVVRLGVSGTDCKAALAEAVADWGRHGYLFDPATMRLLPQAALQASFTSTVMTTNPCDPVTQGGYLGADNQLIRVMISGPGDGSSAALLWGYDNASSLYRVTAQPDGATLQLAQPPVDAYHNPVARQYVEVLRTAAVLGSVTDETGGPAVVRCVAAATGRVTTVKSYSPADNTLVLDVPLPQEYTSDPNPLFLRVWVGRQPFGPSSAAPVVLTDPTGRSTPGLQVTITRPATGAKGGLMPYGAFWLFAVRPATPQALYPSRFLDGPQPPDGPRQWACPLAVIDWAGRDSVSASVSTPAADIHDCRCHFDNLVTLTNRRLGGCCTITVWPADAPRLQAIIDKAARGRGRVTVCLTPGAYALPQPLRLGARHVGLVVESCSGGATLRADPAADATQFADGLIVLVGADGVTLRNLALDVPRVPLDSATVPSLASTQTNLQLLIGVRLVASRGVTVEGCICRFSPQAGARSFGMGLFIEADCPGLVVRGCRFESDRPPTVTQLTSANVTPTAAPSAVLPAHSAPAPAAAGALSALVEAAGLATFARAAAAAPAELVALCGILASPCIVSTRDKRATIQASLDGALSDNEFRDLALAVLVEATIGALAVRGNRATECLGGIWLLAGDQTSPNDPKDATYQQQWTANVNAMANFEEVLTLLLLALELPVPAGDGGTGLGDGAQPVALSLTVTDNRLSAVLSGSELVGTALALFLCRRTADGGDSSSSLVLTSNELRGRSVRAPVALVSTGGSGGAAPLGPTAVTGNLVLNVGFVRYPSLALFPRAGFGDLDGLAVTGNVLVGVTTVGQFAQWKPLNSIII